MELIESIQSINENLKREFGSFTDGRPNFRIVFSEDQYEKRWTNYTSEGFELINPEVRELPKYKQWVHEKYILERLVPTGPDSDLVEKVSYEPCWVFRDKNDNYLPPRFDMCKFVIEALHSQIEKAGTHVKYKDENISKERREELLNEMQEQLFGNETDVTDALAYGSGVSLAGNKLVH